MRILHINATKEFKNNPEKMDLVQQMCEIADRVTDNRTIVETHYGKPEPTERRTEYEIVN